MVPLLLRLDLDRAAAEAFIDAVRDGEHRAPFGRATQRLEHARFGFGVEVCGDLVEQQHGGVRCRGARNGQKLPLALREQPVRAGGVVAVRQRADDFVEARELRGVFRHRTGDTRIAQRDLIEHRARHAGEVLLDAADACASLLVRDGRDVHAADGDFSRLRAVEPQQQAEDRALARARAADECDLLALSHREGEIKENRALAVAERHVRENDISACSGFFTRRGNVALRLDKKRVDALDARHRGLDGLDLRWWAA